MDKRFERPLLFFLINNLHIKKHVPLFGGTMLIQRTNSKKVHSQKTLLMIVFDKGSQLLKLSSNYNYKKIENFYFFPRLYEYSIYLL